MVEDDQMQAMHLSMARFDPCSQVINGMQTMAIGQWGTSRTFLECDYTFWIGDLNYQLNMRDEQVMKTCSAQGCPDCFTGRILKLSLLRYCMCWHL